MPQLFVHLTVVSELRRDERLEPSAAEALSRRSALARLGATLPDLPFTDGGGWRAFLNRIGLTQPDASWSDQLHGATPMALAIALAAPQERARLGPLSRLALASGFLTHAALDSVLRPLVSELVDDEGEAGPRARRSCQQQIERVQSLYFHRHLHGDAQDEPPYLTAAELGDEAAAPRVLHQIAAALQEVYGTAPSTEELGRWVRGLTGHRHTLQQELEQAGEAAGDAGQLRDKYFEGPGFLAAVEAASERAIAWVNRLARTFAPGDLLPGAVEQLREQLPELDLDQRSDPFAGVRWEPDFYDADADATGTSPDRA